MMTRMFEPQLGKNIEIYVNDMVVKSKVVSEHLKDLGGTFNVLRRHKLRLNASKCSFGVRCGLDWVGLDLCDELGWVEFFLTSSWWVGSKNPLTRLMHTPTIG